MCTVSWSRGDRSYHLFFNRDEQHSRVVGLPPRRLDFGGVAVLAPLDPEGGGTWLAVNAFGLTVAILNFYTETANVGPGRRSRGLLVRSLADARDPAEVAQRLAGERLGDYAPFSLLVVPARGPSVGWQWNGGVLTRDDSPDATAMRASSSVRTSEVLAARQRCYAEMVAPDVQDLECHRRFHRQFDPQAGAESVAMFRPDARTVSHCEIAVDETEVRMAYFETPREAPTFVPVSVERLPRRTL